MKRLYIILLTFCFACTNDVKDVEALFSDIDLDTEVATDVEILYSDSSYVRIKIDAPKMIRHLNPSDPYDEFPDGLRVTFYNAGIKPSSWLEAGYAIRKEEDKKVYVKDDVIVYNNKGDKMRTIELIWDENEKLIYTEKPVKIMQPSIGDTLFGYGVIANQDFTRFEIKRKVSAIKRFESLVDKETPEKPTSPSNPKDKNSNRK